MEEAQLVAACVERIARKRSVVPPNQWTNREFEQLSESIYEASGTLVSYQTLRRVFGKIHTPQGYQPQLDTKNALAVYVGFADWEAFRRDFVLHDAVADAPGPGGGQRHHEPSYAPSASSEGASSGVVRSRLERSGLLRGVLLGSGLVLFFWCAYGFYGFLRQPERSASWTFRGMALRGMAPFTARVEYDVRDLAGDSIYVHFGDETAANRLDRTRSVIQHSYSTPGVFRVTLWHQGKPIDTVTVEAQSKGWVALAHHTTGFYYVADSALFQSQGRLHLTEARAQLGENIPRQKPKPYAVEYKNIKDFGVDGDAFRLVVRLRNQAAQGGVYCYDSSVNVYGEKSAFMVTFMGPGCDAWMYNIFSEQVRNGRYEDQSVFTRNLADWHEIELRVRANTCHVFFDGDSIYKVPYRRSVGPIKGLMIDFKGFGEIDYVRLYDHTHRLVYNTSAAL